MRAKKEFVNVDTTDTTDTGVRTISIGVVPELVYKCSLSCVRVVGETYNGAISEAVL